MHHFSPGLTLHSGQSVEVGMRAHSGRYINARVPIHFTLHYITSVAFRPLGSGSIWFVATWPSFRWVSCFHLLLIRICRLFVLSRDLFYTFQDSISKNFVPLQPKVVPIQIETTLARTIFFIGSIFGEHPASLCCLGLMQCRVI